MSDLDDDGIDDACATLRAASPMTPELVERVQAARLYRDDPVNYDDHRFQWAVRVDEIQSDRIEALEAAIVQAREALEEARLQLEYLDERFPTGTTPAAIAKIGQALSALDRNG